MNIRFLGTAAAEGWPALFCECEYCNRARSERGKNIRTRSSCLIDEKYQVDFPPDTFMHVFNNKLSLNSEIKQDAIAAIDDTLLVATLVCFVGIVVAFYIKNKTGGVPEQKMSKEENI